MGGISSIMGMLPGFKGIKQALGSDKFDKSVIVGSSLVRLFCELTNSAIAFRIWTKDGWMTCAFPAA